MGYKRPTTVYRLHFDDHDGLEVRAASVPIGQLLDLTEQADRLKSGAAESFDDARELLDLFAASLRSWNLEEDDGAPIPCTRDSVLGLEFQFATDLLVAWFEAVASVAAPLAQRSTVTLPSEVPSIPMEMLSGSLAS